MHRCSASSPPPSAYGWTWDVQIGAAGVPDIHEIVLEGLSGDQSVRAVAVGTVASLTVDGERVDALAVEDAQGSLRPSIVEGEPPVQRLELALGPLTAGDLGVGAGDQVDVSVGGRSVEATVTGLVVLPEVGDDGQLGRGAYLPLAALEQLVPDPVRTLVLVDFDEGTEATGVENTRAAVAPYPVTEAEDGNELLAVSELASGEGATSRTVLVAPVMIVVVTLVHVLLTSIRRRRREVAVLRSLGFGPAQVVGAVVTQSAVLVAAALAVGIPLGVVAGRALWTVFGRSLGVPAAPVVPVGALVGGSALLILVAGAIALVPALLAARIPASAALRAE